MKKFKQYIKEKKDIILKAKVKNIPINTRVNDGTYEYAFNKYMAQNVGKILKFHLADEDDKDWYVENNKYNAIEHMPDVYHKTWLEFIEQDLGLDV
jgi:hypothetical protein